MLTMAFLADNSPLMVPFRSTANSSHKNKDFSLRKPEDFPRVTISINPNYHAYKKDQR